MRLFGRFSKIMGLAVAMAAFLSAATAQAAENSAITRAVRGGATYSNDKGGTWKKLSVGQKLGGNSTVRTAPGSVVDLFLGDNGPVVRITEDTTMGIDKLSSEGAGVEKVIETELNLKNGRILGNVKKLAKASRYEITTPKGVAGIRGTEYDISANGDVTVISGTVVVVYILPGGQTTTPVTVSQGQTVSAPAPGAAAVVLAPAPPATINAIRTSLGDAIANIPEVRITATGEIVPTTTTTITTDTKTTTTSTVNPNVDPCRERLLSPGASANAGCQ